MIPVVFSPAACSSFAEALTKTYSLMSSIRTLCSPLHHQPAALQFIRPIHCLHLKSMTLRSLAAGSCSQDKVKPMLVQQQLSPINYMSS